MKCKYWLDVSKMSQDEWIDIIRSVYPKATWNSGNDLEDILVGTDFIIVNTNRSPVTVLQSIYKNDAEMEFPYVYTRLKEVFA
jgi:hypothetical protein